MGGGLETCFQLHIFSFLTRVIILIIKMIIIIIIIIIIMISSYTG